MSSALAVAEIGGTSVKIGFACDGVALDFNRTCPTERIRVADPINALAGLLRTAAADAGVTMGAIVATIPGFIDYDRDSVLHAANVPELEGIRLASGLSAVLGIPVRLERDVVLQLLGEAAAGAVAGEREVLAVYFGTGIGAAYLGADGIFRGSGWALELGHLPLRPSGRIEDLASGAHLATLAVQHAVPLADLFLASDPGLATALNDLLWAQSLAVASAAVLISPAIILIGGGVPEMPGFPRHVLDERILAGLPEPYRLRPPELRRAQLGWRAAIHGALALAAP